MLKDGLLSSETGCLVTILVVGFCLGLIFLRIFEPLSWAIWVITGALLMVAFPILLIFRLYDENQKRKVV